jgi:excinuclease ABC subunit C
MEMETNLLTTHKKRATVPYTMAIDLSNIPHKPGVYLHKSKDKKILYIGKAKDLKKRVSQYFLKDHLDSPKTAELVKQISDTEIIITHNEVEALLLESRLIKQYKPKYNIDLKNNERYAYLKFTDETYPRLITIRRKVDKGEYFGPYVSGYQRVLIQKTVNDIFALKTCKNTTERCFNSYIGLCSCPQFFHTPIDEYVQRLKKAKLVLKGQTKEVIEKLTSEMQEFAKKQNYEFAKKRRDQITAIEKLSETQKIELHKEFDQDVIGCFITADVQTGAPNRAIYFIFEIERGTIHKRYQYDIDLNQTIDADEHNANIEKQNKSNNTSTIENSAHTYSIEKINQEVLMQHYQLKQPPKQILVSQNFFVDNQQLELTSQALSQGLPYNVDIKIPQIGDMKKLVDLATDNAALGFGENPTLVELAKILKLPTIPKNIECYDISNLRDEYIVGAKIHFTDGEPNKNEYRKYRIKWQTTQNDFAAMYEVLKRRLSHIKLGEEPAPDLIVIDGGRGQLNAALDARREFGLSIPMIGLAKQEEEIYFPGLSKPLNTKNNADKNSAIRLLQRIRDETHRFVITYHRKLRDGQYDTSSKNWKIVTFAL